MNQIERMAAKIFHSLYPHRNFYLSNWVTKKRFCDMVKELGLVQ